MADYNDMIWEAVAGLCIQHGIMVPTGSRFFVHSGTGTDQAQNGTDPDAPVATLDYAVGLCQANKGDLIICMPGHAETIAAAAEDVDLDCEGIIVACLGNGDNKPTWTFSGVVGADLDIGADNVTIIGARFVNSEDGLTAAIDVDNAYATLIGCQFVDNSQNTVVWITGDANAHYLKVVGARCEGWDTAGNNSFLELTGAAKHVEVDDIMCHGNYVNGNIDLSGGATDVLLKGLYLENSHANDLNIKGHAALTGFIDEGVLRVATDGQVTWVTTPGLVSFGRRIGGVNDDAEVGKLLAAESG